jgi:hypothetical protein
MTKIEALKEVNKNLTSLLTKLETHIFKENIIINEDILIKNDKDVVLNTK